MGNCASRSGNSIGSVFRSEVDESRSCCVRKEVVDHFLIPNMKPSNSLCFSYVNVSLDIKQTFLECNHTQKVVKCIGFHVETLACRLISLTRFSHLKTFEVLFGG